VRPLGLPTGLDPEPAAGYSCVVAFNVLEHIDDHVAALRSAKRLVEPGGPVVMFVPAFPSAMSDFDRRVGHVRRYRRASLTAAYERAGLRVERIEYVNAVGLPAWWLMMRVLHGTPSDSALLRTYDATVVRAMRRIEGLRPAPFGQSLFVVGR